MRQEYCDICKEIVGNNDFIRIKFFGDTGGQHVKECQFTLCEECGNKLVAAMQEKMKEMSNNDAKQHVVNCIICNSKIAETHGITGLQFGVEICYPNGNRSYWPLCMEHKNYLLNFIHIELHRSMVEFMSQLNQQEDLNSHLLEDKKTQDYDLHILIIMLVAMLSVLLCAALLRFVLGLGFALSLILGITFGTIIYAIGTF